MTTKQLASWIVSVVAVNTGCLDACEGIWRELARMPSMRQEVSTAAFEGKIFVMAGYDSRGLSTDTVEVYDPETDTWSRRASLPLPTNHNAAAVAGGKLYAFAGTSKRAFAYDPEQDAWIDVAPMNFMHGDTPAVAVINDWIYVAGGSGGIGNEVEVYDPVQNTWTILTPMNVRRNHTAGGAIDGKFYVVGGRPGAEAASTLEVYDPRSAWLPWFRRHHRSVPRHRPSESV